MNRPVQLCQLLMLVCSPLYSPFKFLKFIILSKFLSFINTSSKISIS
jgi:hypothetical protein